MNSKKYSSNLVSFPLIRENIKRFWVGSLLAFLGYFFLATLPIMMMQAPDASFISTLFSGKYPFYMIILVLVPVVCALLIYRYMQQQSASAIMNALPFSRKSMFHSNFISGAILCVFPILLNALILSLIAQPVDYTIYDANGLTETVINVFSLAAIWKWAFLYSLLTLLLYAVCMFAAVVTGSSLLQAIFSMGFLVLLPALIASVIGYNECFLFGYTTPEFYETLLSWVCPLIGLVSGLSKILLCWYGVCFLILYLASFYLYKWRKMEKATDSITFNGLKPVFKYLATFLSMTVMAFLFYSFDLESDLFFFLGAAIGALLGYVISEMIVQKSIRIKGFVKGFLLYIVLAAVFFGVYAFDLTGYEDSIPQAFEVKEVRLDGLDSDSYETRVLTDVSGANKDLMDELQALHKDLTALDPGLFSRMDYSDGPTEYLNLQYIMNDGSVVLRNYNVPYDFYKKNEHIKNLYNSETLKESSLSLFTCGDTLDPATVITLTATYDYSLFGKSSFILKSQDIAGFTDALRKDVLAETFEQHLSNPTCQISAEFELHSDASVKSSDSAQDLSTYFHYDIKPYYENTIQWLKDMGYYDTIAVTARDISYAEVFLYESDAQNGPASDDWYERGWSGESIGTITDQTQIQTLIDTAKNSTVYASAAYYEIHFYPAFPSTSEDGGDTDSSLYQDYGFARFYEEDQAPDFIRNLK